MKMPKNIKKLRSVCCNARINVSKFFPDFLRDDPKTMKQGTSYFICVKCGKPCNVKIEK